MLPTFMTDLARFIARFIYLQLIIFPFVRNPSEINLYQNMSQLNCIFN